MHFLDLTDTQKRDLNWFNMILEAHGWHDPEEIEKRIVAGENLCPEGKRMITHTSTSLEVEFHAPLNMITLQIKDIITFEQIRFYFFYDEKIERILEWLASVSDRINLESYIECLKEVFGKCEMILIELAKDEIYEVKPPDTAVSNAS
jgi:hypothetical protein